MTYKFKNADGRTILTRRANEVTDIRGWVSKGTALTNLGIKAGKREYMDGIAQVFVNGRAYKVVSHTWANPELASVVVVGNHLDMTKGK